MEISPMAAVSPASVTTRITTRLASAPRELKLFAFASLVMGMSYSMFDSTFNNYLNEKFALTGFQRSFLEFPRELPGLLTVFVTAMLWFLCSRRLGGLAMALGVVGVLLIGFAAPNYAFLVVWLFVYSLGQHLFMPIASGIGMELANVGQTGRRLGQLNAIRNLAAIFGSFIIVIGFKYLGFTFQLTFVLVGVGLAVASSLMFSMKPAVPQPAKDFLKLRKEYRLYYILALLYGSRKQLFITFAPWVLVTVFKQPTSTLATLITIGGVVGIIFQPFLGWMIDHLGERFVLAGEAILLIFVCLGNGFAKTLLPPNVAFILVCACYLVDGMLMSVGMARSTYIKKIARDDSHVQPALTAAITIDHIFSISVALLGGLIWNRFGYQYVFLMGACIALINLFAALQVKVPRTEIASE
jgi:predicted MFS family arabinose efflux permease